MLDKINNNIYYNVYQRVACNLSSFFYIRVITYKLKQKKTL